MMNDLMMFDQAELPASLSEVPTEELKKHLAQAIGVTARTLSYLAAVWAELERRGEDLSALRGGLMSYLPLIAEGRLDPELVVRCAGQAMLLKAASAIPLEDQRRLIDHGARIIELDETGEIKEKAVPVEKLSVHDVRRVFAGDRLRAPAEQATMLGGHRPRETARAVVVKVRLTKSEYDRVRKAASARGRHVPTMIRDVILENV